MIQPPFSLSYRLHLVGTSLWPTRVGAHPAGGSRFHHDPEPTDRPVPDTDQTGTRPTRLTTPHGAVASDDVAALVLPWWGRGKGQTCTP